MKKILLATTVLTMSAGFAAADVSVSGDARMGITSYDGEAQFSSRVRVKFSGSGTTDGGLSFGGSFRAADAEKAGKGTKGSVYISGAFGKISMGDVDSGDSAAVGQLSSVGYEGLGSGNSIAYAADGGGIGFGDNDIALPTNARVLYTYSAGAVTVNASVGQIDNSTWDDADEGDFYGSSNYAVGVSYNAGAVTVALGYGSVSADVAEYPEEDSYSVSLTDTSVSVTYVAGDTTVKAIYQDKVAEEDNVELISETSMGASVDHKMGAITLTGYALSSEFSSPDSDGSYSLNRMGLGVAYDLGGGAVVKAGWVQLDEVVDGDETESYNALDAGINFSF